MLTKGGKTRLHSKFFFSESAPIHRVKQLLYSPEMFWQPLDHSRKFHFQQGIRSFFSLKQQIGE